MKHIIGISGGKDSTALALRLAEVEAQDYEYLITPTGNELPEMHAHWTRLESMLGKKFVVLKPFDGDGLLYLIDYFKALPNWRQRWCTRMLKIEPTVKYLEANAPCIQYVGLRADEETREGIYGTCEGVEQRYPFRDWGWGIEDVWNYLAERGVAVPKRTDCAFCYGQRLIEWKRLLQEHPDLYQRGVEIEAATGHTFRSKGRDTWPAALAELRDEFASGRKVQGEMPRDTQLQLFESVPEYESCRVCRL